MKLETKGQRAVVTFDSFGDFLATNEQGEDYRSVEMDGDPEFYGARNMQQAYALAHCGLPREGIEALNIAEERVQQLDRELIKNQFDPMWDVSGAQVDVARYLEGEPECMVNYTLEDIPREVPIVTIVASLSFHCGISGSAITKHGQAIMALMEAVESTGLQTEVWVENNSSSGYGGGGLSGRTKIRLKGAGELFDAATFMYALTHPSMLRSLIFNSMHYYPEQWRDAMGIAPGSFYGFPVQEAADMDDYPEGAIFLPAIRNDHEAGKVLMVALKELGLLKSA